MNSPWLVLHIQGVKWGMIAILFEGKLSYINYIYIYIYFKCLIWKCELVSYKLARLLLMMMVITIIIIIIIIIVIIIIIIIIISIIIYY